MKKLVATVVILFGGIIYICVHFLIGNPNQNDVQVVSLVPSYSFPDKTDSIFFYNPVPLRMGKKGFFYINDQMHSHIAKFSPKGQFIKFIGREGKGPGDLLEPYSFSIDGNKLVVNDLGNRRVDIFTKDGKYIKSFIYKELLGPVVTHKIKFIHSFHPPK